MGIGWAFWRKTRFSKKVQEAWRVRQILNPIEIGYMSGRLRSSSSPGSSGRTMSVQCVDLGFLERRAQTLALTFFKYVRKYIHYIQYSTVHAGRILTNSVLLDWDSQYPQHSSTPAWTLHRGGQSGWADIIIDLGNTPVPYSTVCTCSTVRTCGCDFGRSSAKLPALLFLFQKIHYRK